MLMPILLAPSELGTVAVVDKMVGGVASRVLTEGSVKSWSFRSEVVVDIRWTMVENSHLRSCGWLLTLFIARLFIVLLIMAEAAVL